MDRTRKAVRDSGILDALYPADQVRMQAAVRQVIDPAGRIVPDAAAPLKTPLVLNWGTAQRTARAGTAVLAACYATTPPSTGSATVTVTMYTELTGEVTLGTVTIPQGRQTDETRLAVAVPAGAWLDAGVTVANGAGGVSTALTVEV